MFTEWVPTVNIRNDGFAFVLLRDYYLKRKTFVSTILSGVNGALGETEILHCHFSLRRFLRAQNRDLRTTVE